MEQIRIRGARTHNLKNLNVDLPRNRLIVITGLSGSGKSSLAFDTLYAEGQRRYVESLSAYARQFLQLMEKPDVDLIEGLSPAISIEQKAASHNPRSTVGTITEIHDYLRLLYARVGTPYCPEHALPLEAQSVAQMVDHALALPQDTKLMILAPIVASRKGEQHELVAELRAQGFVRVRVDGKVYEIDAVPNLSKNVKHSVDVVIDRLKVRPEAKQRLAESFETALRHADGRAVVLELDSGREHLFSARFACPVCDYSLSELDPRLGPAQPVLFPDAREPRRAFQVRRRGCVREAPGARAEHRALRREGKDPVLVSRRARPHPREGARLRGHPAEPGAALQGNRLAHGARGAGEIPERQGLPDLRRHAAPDRGAARQGRRQGDLRSERDSVEANASFFREARALRRETVDRREDREGNRLAPLLPQQRGPGLSVARPLRRHAIGRRGAAHPPREPDRLGAHRRDVRARRAFHRAAPARQRPAARHA